MDKVSERGWSNVGNRMSSLAADVMIEDKFFSACRGCLISFVAVAVIREQSSP